MKTEILEELALAKVKANPDFYNLTPKMILEEYEASLKSFKEAVKELNPPKKPSSISKNTIGVR